MKNKVIGLCFTFLCSLLLFFSKNGWSEIPVQNNRNMSEHIDSNMGGDPIIVNAASLEIEEAPTRSTEVVFDDESEQKAEEAQQDLISSL
jgi:hypothetical protein